MASLPSSRSNARSTNGAPRTRPAAWGGRWRVPRWAWGISVVAIVAAAGAWAADNYVPLLFQSLAQHNISLQSPEWLWIACALPILWVGSVFSLSDLPWPQRVLSAAIRSAIVLLVSATLTQPTRHSQDPVPVAVGVAVDVSDSLPETALDKANSFIGELWSQRGDVPVHVVRFARTAAGVPTSDGGAAPRIGREEFRTDATDIAAGLRLARAGLPEGAVGRLLLISDGVGTQGLAAAEANLAASQATSISWIDLGTIDPPGEVWARALRLPEGILPRVPFAAQLDIESNRPGGAALCSLTLDGGPLAEQRAELDGGPQTLTFTELRIPKGGERRLEANCVPEPGTADRFSENNRVAAIAMVPEKPKVLYVEGSPLQSGTFAAALSGEFDVETRGAAGFPASASSLAEYHAVVVSDVARRKGLLDQFTDGHAAAVRAYVEQGGVFLYAGGPDGYGSGGYEGSALEKRVLPVKMSTDKTREQPSVALVLVLDKSGSMAGDRIEMAKEAAKATATALKPDDLIGVVVFDAAPETLIPLSRAANRVFIVNQLSRLQAGGGTSIRPALEQAYRILSRADAQTKHVILLSDGQAERSGIAALAERMFREKITISTVALGEEADTALLQQVAAVAGGNAYRTTNPSEIRRIFLGEATQQVRSSIVEERFSPRIGGAWGRLQAFRGVSFAPLRGYCSTQPKPGADLLMTTHRGEPLLARQRLGLGWSIAWTSDLKTRWSKEFASTGSYARFWRQLLRSHMPVSEQDTFPLNVHVGRGRLRLQADAVDRTDRFLSGLSAVATVRPPAGEPFEVQMPQSAPGHYEAELALSDESAYGIWEVQAEFFHPELEEPIATAKGSGGAPYPDEWALTGTQAPDILEALANATGGRKDPQIDWLLAPSGEALPKSAPVEHDLLLWALVALVLDVALRRIRLAPARSVN